MSSQVLPVRVTKAQSFVMRLERITTLLSRWLNWVAGAGLIVMLALVIGDIVGIKILSKPVPGGIEIVAFLGVVVTGFAVAWTQVLHGHIQVDFITMRLTPYTRVILEVLTGFLGMAVFALLAWQSWEYGQMMRDTGEVSMTKRIPFYPFIWGLALCYLITFFVLTVEFIKSILKVGKKWNQ